VHRDRSWTDAADWREDELSGQAERGGDSMHPTGVTANLSVADLVEARDFYVDFLGLSVEGFNLGWVVNLQSPDGRAVVQLVTRDGTAPVDSVISVHVGDEVEAAYEEAQRRGLEIVHPLTTEPWGVRRFFVRAPDGNIINIVNHKDEDA
jgi:catechol 2,3-dioxygenase-like lactoylglutathione lyase family enzyme